MFDLASIESQVSPDLAQHSGSAVGDGMTVGLGVAATTSAVGVGGAVATVVAGAPVEPAGPVELQPSTKLATMATREMRMAFMAKTVARTPGHAGRRDDVWMTK
jgi:hypothetical protein